MIAFLTISLIFSEISDQFNYGGDDHEGCQDGGAYYDRHASPMLLHELVVEEGG